MKHETHAVPLPRELRHTVIAGLTVRLISLCAIYLLFTYALFFRTEYYDTYYSGVMDRGWAQQLTLIVLFYILPLFALKIPQLLLDRDWEGEVLEIEYKVKLKLIAGLSASSYEDMMRNQILISVCAKIRMPDGSERWRVVRNYEPRDPFIGTLTVGSYVRHYKWCRYNQILTDGFRVDVDCIICGMYTYKKYDRCDRCGRLLVKDERVLSPVS